MAHKLKHNFLETTVPDMPVLTKRQIEREAIARKLCTERPHTPQELTEAFGVSCHSSKRSLARFVQRGVLIRWYDGGNLSLYYTAECECPPTEESIELLRPLKTRANSKVKDRFEAQAKPAKPAKPAKIPPRTLDKMRCKESLLQLCSEEPLTTAQAALKIGRKRSNMQAIVRELVLEGKLEQHWIGGTSQAQYCTPECLNKPVVNVKPKKDKPASIERDGEFWQSQACYSRNPVNKVLTYLKWVDLATTRDLCIAVGSSSAYEAIEYLLDAGEVVTVGRFPKKYRLANFSRCSAF